MTDDLLDELAETATLVSIPQHGAVHGFDTAALFLLDWQYPNLFEPVSADPAKANAEYRCKGCQQIVPAAKREKHHTNHCRARDAGRYNTGGTKMATATDKPKKVTALDQGFPQDYLADNGNFKPGYDARAKSDLIAAILGLDTSKSLASFTKAEAEKLVKARGWESFVEKKKATIEGEAARKAKREEEAAAAAKTKADEKAAKAQAKSSGSTGGKAGDVKPDPKPEKTKGGMK